MRDVETKARELAALYGGRMVLRRDGQTFTNADLAGFKWQMDNPSWAQFAEAKWRDFLPEAEKLVGTP